MKFLDLGDDSASNLVSVSAKKKKNLSSELDLVEAQARAEAERSRLPRQTIIFRKLRPGQPEQTNAIAKNSKNLVFAKKLQNFGLGQRISKTLEQQKWPKKFFGDDIFNCRYFYFPASIQRTVYKLVLLPVSEYKSFLGSHVATSVVKFKPRTLVFTF